MGKLRIYQLTFVWLFMFMGLILVPSCNSQQGSQVSMIQPFITYQVQIPTKPYLPTMVMRCLDNCYYVDSVNGSDANPGTSVDKPWRTLTPVNNHNFLPGDVVGFKRGSSWTDMLTIKDSGQMDNPIVFTTYGIGDRPVIRNPGEANHYTQAVTINASWIIVSGLMLRDTSEAGLFIKSGADNNIVQNLEVTNTGVGILIAGQHNLITTSYFHDLHMVVNIPGGNYNYGAVGIVISNTNNEASYNTMINCKAPSYDPGGDGGAIEFFGTADNNYIHHNWAMNNKGFIEVGGGSARNDLLAYNVTINNGWLFLLHLSDQFASTVENFRVENNTVIENGDHWGVFSFIGDPNQNTLLVRNNIFYVNGFHSVSDKTGFTHIHNLYSLFGDTVLGYDLGEGEIISTNPLFVDMNGLNFDLLPGSPAIDAGIIIGNTVDFENRPVPSGSSTDIGAFEYQSPP